MLSKIPCNNIPSVLELVPKATANIRVAPSESASACDQAAAKLLL